MVDVTMNGIVKPEAHGPASVKLSDANASAEATGGDRLTGECVMFDLKRGFAFIRRDDGAKDCFAHITNIRGGNIAVGDRVEYTVREGRQGKLAAFDVAVVR